jgi:hypothetical protein
MGFRTVSFIPRKKVLISILRKSQAEARNGTELREKITFTKNPAPANRIESVFCPQVLRNRIPRVCFYFCAADSNSDLFSLPWNSSERNSKCLLQFSLHGMDFQVVFLSAECFRTELREFASIVIPPYRILSIFILCGMVRNGCLRVFCSTEQQEIRWNKPIVSSIPSSTE